MNNDIGATTQDNSISNAWLDGQEVMLLLHISQRTLQTWRTNRKIGYSKLGKKIFYKVSDINKMLEERYTPCAKEGGDYEKQP